LDASLGLGPLHGKAERTKGKVESNQIKAEINKSNAAQ
jgi:hypothetical protein